MSKKYRYALSMSIVTNTPPYVNSILKVGFSSEIGMLTSYSQVEQIVFESCEGFSHSPMLDTSARSDWKKYGDHAQKIVKLPSDEGDSYITVFIMRFG